MRKTIPNKFKEVNFIIYTEEILEEALNLGRKYLHEGAVADYIPELAKVEANKVAISTIEDGKLTSVGDSKIKFSIQSIVKVILYALAMKNYKVAELKKYVGVRPSAKPFNSVIELELSEKRIPVNPFINAGAIIIVAILHNVYREKTFDVILKKASEFLGEEVDYSREIAESEKESSFTNRTLIYLMLAKGILPSDTKVEEVLDTYFKACSILVNTENLAHMSYVISNDGIDLDGKEIITAKEAKVLRSLMATCGTYDYSGDFAIRVGFPAKSGVGGGIVTASKNKNGLAVYAPRLDKHGNSYSGVRMLEFLSQKLDLSIY
ncbi:glutaminase A [uncultured Peptoniphilus sp.]|uniref:glutaminase A n=1 Tax=uncultured Peptoniphilus sp. TaxID=254354 RepID=UPI002582737A|nr:glutaminase A [uncultured Peptoniphilus sp.]MDU6783863.1 glutaminase A [Peptoniphilus harei]